MKRKGALGKRWSEHPYVLRFTFYISVPREKVKDVNTEGPVLESLTHRLQECPAAFLEEPRIGDEGLVDVAAVVADLLRVLKGSYMLRSKTNAFVSKRAKERNRLRLVLVASWVLHDPWFQGKGLHEVARRVLEKDLRPLAKLVDAEQFVNDPDRREELVRVILKNLGLRPRGETKAQAEDQLATLDSIQRARVVREAKAAEERARKIREAMRIKREKERAAAKPMRE